MSNNEQPPFNAQPYEPNVQQQPPVNAQQPPSAMFPPQGGGYYFNPPVQRWNGLCIAGFVTAFLIPPVGLVLSIIALVQINKSREKSKGMAIAGIVISVIGTLIIIACIAFVVWFFGFVLDHVEPTWCDEYGSGLECRGYDSRQYDDDCAFELNGQCYSMDDLENYGDDLLDEYGLDSNASDFASYFKQPVNVLPQA
jgi:hypothetical protein